MGYNQPMIYHPELYYLQDSPDFPLDKAFLVTAKTVSAWSKDYFAGLVAPKKGTKDKSRSGDLPKDKNEREELIEDLYGWIKENSDVPDLFAMFLYGDPRRSRPDECEKFDHHDTTSCWALNLTDTEFASLQKAWQENDLPNDIFFPRDKSIQKGIRYYTPKDWEMRNK